MMKIKLKDKLRIFLIFSNNKAELMAVACFRYNHHINRKVDLYTDSSNIKLFI